MRIEKDAAEFLSGLRFGWTLGSPIAVLVRNRDWANWTGRMAQLEGGPDERPVRVPRPGHADLAGGLKYGHTGDLRNILERASARETAMRVALGAVARAFLRDLGIELGSYVRSIGGVEAVDAAEAEPGLYRQDAEALALRADGTPTRALTPEASALLEARIDEAMRKRDTVGGVVEVVVTHVPVGLGAHVQGDRKLDGRLAAALMQVPAIKAVEVGDGIQGGVRLGSEQHDPILWKGERLGRSSNHAGGLEGGITNGEPLVLRAVMKPIATLSAALPSVDLQTQQAVPAHVERSDTCAVPAAGVVAEAAVALALADAVLEALGGDTMDSLRGPFARLRLLPRRRVGSLYLVGPMGAGKSVVGAALAKQSGLPFVDLDKEVEAAAGVSVRELFASRGEAAFRALEAEALARVANGPASVVALGGGAATTDAAWRLIRESGVAVRLQARVDTLLSRLGAGLAERPLLAGGNPGETLTKLLHARERWYGRADVSVDTEGRSPEAVAQAALGAVEALRGPLR
jgi:chorismate synthase